MSVRTKARNRNSGSSDHYEIEGSTKVQCKSYILARKTLFKDPQFSDEIPPTEKDLRAYLNSGDEVKHLLQAAVSRAKRAGITCEVLLSGMDTIKRWLHSRILLFLKIWMIYWILMLVWNVIRLLMTVVFKEGRGINSALRKAAHGAETPDMAYFTNK